MKYELTGRTDFIGRNRSELQIDDAILKARQKVVEGIKSVHIEKEPLLSIIYACDDSGLPAGDLSLYLGENCNPDVRDYIQKNILVNVSSPDLQTADLDDDVIMNLTRGVDESRHEYIARINQYMTDTIAYEKTRIEYEKLSKRRDE